MDLHFTPEQESFRAEVRAWIAESLALLWSEKVRDLAHDADSLVELRRRWQSHPPRALHRLAPRLGAGSDGGGAEAAELVGTPTPPSGRGTP